MGVHDVWYKTRKGPNGQRIKTAKYGRGKRWRVTYTDATGEPREQMFEREDDAKNFDAACRTGAAPEVWLDHSERNVTFPSYADRWREARIITWGIETAAGSSRTSAYT